MTNRKLARECGGAHSPGRVQNFRSRCIRHLKAKPVNRQAPISFDATPLWRAAEARELANASNPVRMLKTRHRLPLHVAKAIAEANGFGMGEDRS